ncbi:hypothetical protein FDP41_005839 [Naegleria fowleri]|uniref:Uncharacterized protein n=1 Tax=Naegleria fowleri TaxID=5763 RepID=A0A6A5BJQ5_NAEFO|nr:uncharacterized protein FDP41_005839 [Naegleria fowleri]KAF0975086.1 hypothetical protein FDP41_005839 [Naegleria fowleri]
MNEIKQSVSDEQIKNQSSSEKRTFDEHVFVKDEIESLKNQLEKEKQTNKKISSNVKKLKKKLIDVSSLLELQDNLKKKIEEQVLEIMKLRQHNQSLFEQNESLKQQCSKLEKNAKSSTLTLDQSQIIQQLRFEKMSNENTISSLKNDLEKVKSEKQDLLLQIEQNHNKLQNCEFLTNQVQELRGLLTHAQKELSELRERRGFISYSDFAVVRPSVVEEHQKKEYKSIAVNTDPIQMDWSKCPNCAAKQTFGNFVTSAENTTPKQHATSLPQLACIQSPPKEKPQNKRKMDEKLASSFKKPKQTEATNVPMSQLSLPFSEAVPKAPPVLPKLKKVSSIRRNTDTSSPHLPFLRIESKSPQEASVKQISAENPLQKPEEPAITIPDIPSIYFEKQGESSVAQYIENIFMNFICNFETFISDKVLQARVLGEIVKTCKMIWKQYSEESTQITEGVSNVIIRLITEKATFIQWNLFIIMLDHLDIYSCHINLLEKLMNEAEIFVTQVLLENTNDQNYSRLIALLAGQSTICNTRFARLDFCMFSKMKELFYNILQFALRNEWSKTRGLFSVRCLQLLLAMVSANKRLLRNGFDPNSGIDMAVALVFKQIVQSNDLTGQDKMNEQVILTLENFLEFCALDLSVEDVCDMLLNNIDNFQTNTYQIPNSLALIGLSVNDWNWTYNYLIFGKLWPKLLHYLSNKSHVKLQIVLTSICKLAISRSQLHPQRLYTKEWQLNDLSHDGQLQLLEKLKGILLLDNVFTFETVKLAADIMAEILINRLACTSLEQDMTIRSNHEQFLKPYADFLKDWYLKRTNRTTKTNVSAVDMLIDVV